MVNREKVLLVEGFSDKSFFLSLLKEANIISRQDIKVEPHEPQLINDIFISEKRGKNNLIQSLPSEIIEVRQNKKQIAIIVDADYPELSPQRLENGYNRTLETIRNIVMEGNNGFLEETRIENSSGWIFYHQNSLIAPIGLWIMPNNHNDGMLEDFILPNLKPEYADFLQEAKAIIDTKKKEDYVGRFNINHHSAKAQLGTWKSWYHRPDDCISADKLDMSAPNVQQLIVWLKKLYKL